MMGLRGMYPANPVVAIPKLKTQVKKPEDEKKRKAGPASAAARGNGSGGCCMAWRGLGRGRGETGGGKERRRGRGRGEGARAGGGAAAARDVGGRRAASLRVRQGPVPLSPGRPRGRPCVTARCTRSCLRRRGEEGGPSPGRVGSKAPDFVSFGFSRFGPALRCSEGRRGGTTGGAGRATGTPVSL